MTFDDESDRALFLDLVRTWMARTVNSTEIRFDLLDLGIDVYSYISGMSDQQVEHLLDAAVERLIVIMIKRSTATINNEENNRELPQEIDPE